MLGIFLFNSKFISTVNDEIKENFNDQIFHFEFHVCKYSI